MTQSFRYRAFLSYSHADEAAATRLHRALENYVLPRRVRKAHALPRRLIPIFRDVDELAASSGLTTRLQDALDQSQWLIVLCSPASAQSKYVNQEIEYFLQKHGASRILCALAEGEPPDCFPPALRALNEEPLAADFRPGKDFELSKLKLIAALAGVGFTELRSREAQRRKRQQLIAASLVGAVALGALAYWDLFGHEHVAYYQSYVRRDGIWHGLNPISADDASHRAASWRFLRHGRLNPPERVDYVNGSGTCVYNWLRGEDFVNLIGERPDYNDIRPTRRYCAATFAYAGSAIQRETLLDGLGTPVLSFVYTATDLVQLTRSGFATPSEGAGVRYVQLTRDGRGFDTVLRFLYAPDLPRPNAAGDYGYRIEYDDAGRALREEGLDGSGQPHGQAIRYEYSDAGITTEIGEDSAGQPRAGHDGCASRRFEHDEWGNRTRFECRSETGALTLTINRFAIRTFTYDVSGNNIMDCLLDEQGQPTLTTIDDAACRRTTYDDRGQQVRIEVLGLDGKPGARAYGAAGFEYDFDERGLVREYRYVDGDRRLIESWRGNAITRLQHDERGNVVAEELLGVDGKPVMSAWGAQVRRVYDSRNLQVEIAYLDATGQPSLRPDVGYAIRRTKHDERGNVVEERYFGADGKPVLRRERFAVLQQAFDDVGNMVERRYLGLDDRPTHTSEGFAVSRASFDRLGRQVEERFFDAALRPARHQPGYFGYRTEYDARDRVAGIRYLDAAGAVAVMPDIGRAGERYRRDVAGNVLEAVYLDADGQELHGTGPVRERRRYDRFNKLIESRTFDAEDRPVAARSSGCAAETKEYNVNGLLAIERCLDAAGRPANRRPEGWATRHAVMKHARLVREEFLDARGKPVKPKA